ncbi:MAG: SDH family Clp fold serine proteinase [Sphingomicrobium sp.]
MSLPPNDGTIIGDHQFPRTDTIPVQSAKYWVNQKDRYLRQLLIRDIEKLTQRRLVVYFANRFDPASQIDASDPAYFVEVLSDVQTGEPVDLMIETNGGMTDATEAIVAILRDRLPNFRAVVVNAAKSNGTLIALAAQSILMGSASELGPIDPAINDIPCTILAKTEFAGLNFPLHQIGILGLKQTQSLAAKLLREGMMNSMPEKVEATVQALATRDVYFSHGSTIDHKEAASLGLKVDFLPHDDPVWERLWLLYTMYDFDARRDRYLKIYEGRGRSVAVAQTPPNSN